MKKANSERLFISVVGFCLIVNSLYAVKVEFAQDGKMIVDGKRFFPIALYSISSEETMKRILPEVKNAGINCWLGSWAQGEKLKKLMDIAHQNGMMFVPYLSHSSFMKGKYAKNPQVALNSIKKKAEFLKSHPALLGWYICNECMDGGAKPRYIKQLSDAIHQITPNNPTFVLPTVHYPARNIWRKAKYCCDAFLMDCYPIGNAKYGNVRWIDRAMDVIADSPHGNRLWAIIQGFNKKDFPGLGGSKNGRYPTKTELRFMAFLPIIRGANGICWYFGYERYKNKPNPFPDNPEFWTRLLKIIKEVASVYDGILAPEVTDGITFLPLHIFGHLSVRKVSPKEYMVFVANVLNKRTDIRIMMDFLTSKYKLCKIIGKDTRIKISPKKVQITGIKPYGITVFTLSRKKYRSIARGRN